MTFDLKKYQTLKDLYDEETLVGEDEITGELLNPTIRRLKFSIKHWCDNLDNIIEND